MKRAFIPAWIWTIVLLILSLMPAGNVDTGSFFENIPIDKIAHFVMYAVYSGVLMYGFRFSGLIEIENKHWILSFSIAAIFGIIMELCQHFFFTDRHFELLDIIANIIGSIVGLIIFKILFKK